MLSTLVRSDLHQESLNTRLETAKQTLLEHRARRASYARRADTEGQSKEKFLRSAERPWEAVE